MIEFGNGKQLLQLIPQKQFEVLCTKWSINHGVRRFSAWDQVCTFIMAFMLRLETMREIEMVLAVPRSTFSDANAKRSAGFFQEICNIVVQEIEGVGGRRKARSCNHMLLALDSTECDVHGTVGVKHRTWRKRKCHKKQAAAKLHAIWNIQDGAIGDYRVTTARSNDSPIANQFPIKPGAIYVFDRGYTDLWFWWKIVDSGSHFVSRLKTYKNYRRDTKKLKLFPKNQVGVLWDGNWRPCKQVVRIWRKTRKVPVLRRILYRDPDTKKTFEFVTSNHRLAAQTVADIYRKRWSVELLFRWMKGHLGIRRLKMKNINAIKIQLAMAVLMQLLTQLYRLKNRCQTTLWECLRGLRVKLALQGLGNEAAPTINQRSGPSRALEKQRVSTI